MTEKPCLSLSRNISDGHVLRTLRSLLFELWANAFTSYLKARFSGRPHTSYFLTTVYLYFHHVQVPIVRKVMTQQNTCIQIWHNRSHERLGVQCSTRSCQSKLCRDAHLTHLSYRPRLTFFFRLKPQLHLIISHTDLLRTNVLRFNNRNNKLDVCEHR